MAQPFLSEIRIMSFNFAPKGWAQCNGQLLAINQNQALFSLLGTTYGGNGQTTFALPDLRGRVPISQSNSRILGEMGGQTSHTLIVSEMAAHNHSLMADAATAGASNTNVPASGTVLGQSAGVQTPSGSFSVSIYGTGNPGATLAAQVIGLAGGSQAHENMQPYLALNFCIALQGIFPSPN